MKMSLPVCAPVRVDIDAVLDKFTQSLITIAKAELPEAEFSEDDKTRFIHQGQIRSTQWPLAEEQGWQFFRLLMAILLKTSLNALSLGIQVIKKRMLCFSFGSYPITLADLEELLKNQTWLDEGFKSIRSACRFFG